jgi:S-adenosylmethionine synthetase
MSKQLYSAEFIFPGHPDKLSDAIADALVCEAHRREARALVGVEVAVHRDHVYVTGRIGCVDAHTIDVQQLVQDVYESAGYNDTWYPAPSQVQVVSNLCLGPLEEGESEFRALADDQAVCIGYANDLVSTNHLPVEQWLVSRLAKRLHALRLDAPELELGPDGKVLIAVSEVTEGYATEAAIGLGMAFDSGARSGNAAASVISDKAGLGLEGKRSWGLEHFSCSLQQKVASDEVALHRAVRLAVKEELALAAALLPGLSVALPQHLTVNGAGAFEVGGPEGDNGLSGKKLVVDAYGPRVPIGGGAWSGKDFYKADRAGGMHARRLAKMIVQLGIATEAQVVLGWFPGDQQARVLRATGAGGVALQVEHLVKNFDLSLNKSGDSFSRKDLTDIARWGHFSDATLPWEVLGLL